MVKGFHASVGCPLPCIRGVAGSTEVAGGSTDDWTAGPQLGEEGSGGGGDADTVIGLEESQ